MSFTVDAFDDPLKWNEYIKGTGTVINRSPAGFQCFLPFGGDPDDPLSIPPIPAVPGDAAGLVSVQAMPLPDVSIRADAMTRDTRLGITADPTLSNNYVQYHIERDKARGSVIAWSSGVVVEIPDPIPTNQLADMRIQYTEDPDTVTWPNGRLSFYYEGDLIVEVSPFAHFFTPLTPLHVFITCVNNYQIPVHNTTSSFQTSDYIPSPRSFSLTVNSSIEGIEFDVKRFG